MKSLLSNEIARHRRDDLEIAWGCDPGSLRGGIFMAPALGTPGLKELPAQLRIIVGIGAGWDHVSVSLETRCPTWGEMEFVKRLFFRDDETAIQLHVPPADHINHHAFTLHLWRPHMVSIPRPPAWMVGPSTSAAALP